MNDCTIIDSPLRYSSRRVFMPWVPLGAEEYALEFRVLGISPVGRRTGLPRTSPLYALHWSLYHPFLWIIARALSACC